MSLLQKLSARVREFPARITTLDRNLAISSDSATFDGARRAFQSFQAKVPLAFSARPHTSKVRGRRSLYMRRYETSTSWRTVKPVNSEHQVAHHFVRSLHPHGSPAVVVL